MQGYNSWTSSLRTAHHGSIGLAFRVSFFFLIYQCQWWRKNKVPLDSYRTLAASCCLLQSLGIRLPWWKEGKRDCAFVWKQSTPGFTKHVSWEHCEKSAQVICCSYLQQVLQEPVQALCYPRKGSAESVLPPEMVDAHSGLQTDHLRIRGAFSQKRTAPSCEEPDFLWTSGK